MSILFPLLKADFSQNDVVASMVSSPATLVGLSVCGIASIAYVHFWKWREEWCDKLGFSVCSDAAQKAAPRYLDVRRRRSIYYRNIEEGSYLSKMRRKFLITEDGNNRSDFFHPSFTNRIKYLQAMVDKSS